MRSRTCPTRPPRPPEPARDTRLFSGRGQPLRLLAHRVGDVRRPPVRRSRGRELPDGVLPRASHDRGGPESALDRASDTLRAGVARRPCLLLVFVAGAVIGAARLRREAIRAGGARTAMVAATGVAVVWLVDTSGDWMHLIPGVSAIALLAVAVLCRGRWSRPDEATSPARSSTARTRPGDRLAEPRPRRSQGRASCAPPSPRATSMTRGPRSAHAARRRDHDANRALRLDPSQLDAYYVKAAALARFDRAAAARATLSAAARPGSEDVRHLDAARRS